MPKVGRNLGSKKGALPTPNGQLCLADYEGERIIQIPLTELHEPDPHPFIVQDDDAMEKLAESVKEYGVREPGLARRREDGGYELLSGNRRKMACEIAGLTAMPVIVRRLNDDEAAITMVE